MELCDYVRTNKVARSLAGKYLLASSLLRPASTSTESTARLQRLCRAARQSTSTSAMISAERTMMRILNGLDPRDLDWQSVARECKTPRVEKGAILKPFLGVQEKGIIFVSFEDQLLRLLNAPLERLAEQFAVVVSPTWSPPHHIILSAFPRLFPGHLFTLISNHDDVAIIPRLSPRYTVIPLYASSWVNPDYYAPRPKQDRDIDLLMVANFGTYKRHFAFFKALRRMPTGLTIVLIGQEQDGRTRDTILNEARLYGVADRVDVRCNVTNEDLSDAICRAKATTIFSMREGSCVVVAESLFGDTPVALLANAAIGSKAFINDETGRLINPANVSEELYEFLNTADRYSPRAWADKNISCSVSTAKMNGILRHAALEREETWTQDIATLCWRPNPRLPFELDRRRLAAEYARVKDEFGLEFLL